MESRTVSLGDIAEICAGNPAPQNLEDFSLDGEPFVRMQDVGREHHTRALSITTDRVSASAVVKYRLRRFPKGTLLIPKSGASIHLNHRALLAQDAYVVSHLATVIPDTSLVDPDYLYFWSLTFDPRNQAQTTSLPSLPTSLIKSARLTLPSLPEQRRIVDLLSRAEGIVRLRREASAKAAELIPALFLDMFGDPAANPKGWEMVAMGEVATVGSGSGFPIADQGHTVGDYPFYKVGDMNLPGNEERMDASRNYIDEATRARLRATAFPTGTVIFPKIGAAIATNKKRLLSRPACVDNNVMAVVPGDRILPVYLHGLFLHTDLSHFASDSNPPSIRKTAIEAWQIPVPPIETQARYREHVESVRGMLALHSTGFATARATFDALLHRTFAAA